MFLNIVDKHAPFREKRIKRANQPEWINDKILERMSQRDNLKEFGNEKSYRITGNRTNELIEKAKTEFYTILINENQSNSKKLWDYMNELAPKDSKQTPSSLEVDGHKITDPLEIGNSFNNLFTSILQTYIPFNEYALLDLTNLRNFVKSKIEPSDMFSIPIMSEDQVLKFLGDLDETKTTGMDGVSAKLLKMAAHVLAKPLTKM